MRIYLAALSLLIIASACATSSPLDGLAETEPTAPASDADALVSAALAYAVADPASDLVPLTTPERVPVGAEYHVREGDGWAPRPITASALPAETGKRFVIVGEDEAYARAEADGEFAWLSVSLDRVAADTASVTVGRRTLYSSPGDAHPTLRPGFGASGSAQIGRFVRSGSSWEFDEWTGWVGT